MICLIDDDFEIQTGIKKENNHYEGKGIIADE